MKNSSFAFESFCFILLFTLSHQIYNSQHLELVARSSKRDAEEELVQESSKRLKTRESLVPAEEPKVKEEEELSQERIQQMMIIVPEQGMNVEALQTKYPIIDWEIYTEEARKEDLVKLWSLVKVKFTSTKPTEDKERELWVELKRLFKPDTDDELWKLQKNIHDVTWRLGVLTQMLVAKLLVEQDSEMSRELLRKIFMQSKSYFKESLKGLYNLYYAKYGNTTQSSQTSGGATSSKESGGNKYSHLLNGLKAHTKKKARTTDPTMSSEYERYVNLDFVTHLHPKDFASFYVLGFWKEKETMFPVLSRIAMVIISVQASSVASESAFSTSGRVFRDVHVFEGSLGR
ncbi:zinc finger BED domain-containing protein RICESLEEPER 2-like protein [Tanacetum coccineum]